MKLSTAVIRTLAWMVLGTPGAARPLAKSKGNDKLDAALDDLVQQVAAGSVGTSQIKFPELMLKTSDDMPIVEIRGTKADNDKIIESVEAHGGMITGCFRLFPGACSAAIPLTNLTAFTEEGIVGSVKSEASQAMSATISLEICFKSPAMESRSASSRTTRTTPLLYGSYFGSGWDCERRSPSGRSHSYPTRF